MPFTAEDYFRQKAERERIQQETRARRQEEQVKSIQEAYSTGTPEYRRFAESRYNPEILQEAQPSQLSEIERIRQANYESGFVSIDPRIQTSEQRAETITQNIVLKRALPTTLRGVDVGGSEVRIEPRQEERVIGYTAAPKTDSFTSQLRKSGEEDLIRASRLRQENKVGYLYEASGQTKQYFADFGEGTYETIKDPKSWAVVGATFLLTRNPKTAFAATKLLETALPIYAMNEFSLIGRKEKTLGTSMGEFAAYGGEFKTFELAPKAFKLQALLLTGGLVGGRSAKQRSGKITKTELRKQSYQAQRNQNIFFDKGEVGVRVRSPELKETAFTKERVIRFGSEEGIPKIVEIKDVQLGKRGSLTTRFDKSFKGKGSEPSFRKLYPEGYYSQSLNLKGKQDLLGVTLVRQKLSTNIYSKRGKVPELGFKETPSNKQIALTEQKYYLTQKNIPKQFPKKYLTAEYITLPEQRLYNKRVSLIYETPEYTRQPPITKKEGLTRITPNEATKINLEYKPLTRYEVNPVERITSRIRQRQSIDRISLLGEKTGLDFLPISKQSYSYTQDIIQEQDKGFGLSFKLSQKQSVLQKQALDFSIPLDITPFDIPQPSEGDEKRPRKKQPDLFIPPDFTPTYPTYDKPGPEPDIPPLDKIIPPLIIEFPSLKQPKGFDFSRSRRKKTKIKYKYLPSVTGIAFNLKTPITKRQKILTGFEVRGL